MSAKARAGLLVFALAASACAHANDAGAGARKAVVEANLEEIQICWDDLAAAHPEVSGSLLFEVDLRKNGSVEWVDVSVDEVGVPKLVTCAVRRIKKWQFPADRKRRSISFGVGFTAAGS